MNVACGPWRQNYEFGHLAFLAILLALTMGFVSFPEHPVGLGTMFPRAHNDQLGAEYNSIAKAIRQGRGFADPFNLPTGPTAWMAPILPGLLASFYWLTNDSPHSVRQIVLVIKGFALLLAACVVLQAIKYFKPGRERAGPRAACIVFILVVLSQFEGCFLETHDEWILLIWVCIILLWGFRFWRRSQHLTLSSRHMLGWGVVGGLIALTSPVLGFAWACVTASGKCFRKWQLLGCGLASMITISPWLARNYVVFGDIIPVKSNLSYELWQSHCADPDGVLDAYSFVTHPWVSRAQFQLYADLGESAFVGKARGIALQSLAREPAAYVNRVANRFLAATVYYQPLFQEDEEFRFQMLFCRYVFFLAFLSVPVIVAFADPKTCDFRIPQCAMYLVATYLTPYILVSYYPRYALALLPAKAIFICCVWFVLGDLVRWLARHCRREPLFCDT